MTLRSVDGKADNKVDNKSVRRTFGRTVVLLGLIVGLAGSVPMRAGTRDRVTQAIVATERMPLANAVDRRALAGVDLGAADPALRMQGITLRFAMTDAQQGALTKLLQEQQQVGSSNYHKWLTPEQYGEQFGLSAGDLAKVTAWLTSEGFTVTTTARSRTFVQFSGTAGQVAQAFGTTIHGVSAEGATHYANLTNPQLPAALGGVVGAMTGLHDFRLKPRVKVKKVAAESSVAASAVRPEFFSANPAGPFIAPGDFYTIYDEAPLLSSSINGTGITIAVMGQVDISTSDVAAFRTASGLSSNLPTTRVFGTDPGSPPAACLVANPPNSCTITGDDLAEAQLDVEWSGAAAPSASILYVNSLNVIDTSLTQAIDNNLAPIMSVSYGLCEAGYGASSLTSFNAMFEQATAEGITIMGPAGDSGAADCDFGVTTATNGLAVDFPASSPFVTGVGGTMFNEGTGTYFSSTNGTNAGSALSYIPEAVWNESAAQGQLAAGGGGASAFFTKPAWQVGTGVPTDFSRDVPDLALNAGVDHDGYLFCTEGSCTNGFRDSGGNLEVVGGTSVSTPSFAGLLALVEQKISSRIGNANPTLYSLANSSFYSNVFHDVATGSNAVACTAGTPNCPSGGTIGYTAGTGFDLASGWGSVDAFNLVNDWLQVTPIGTTAGQVFSTTAITTTAGTVVVGTSITFKVAVASGSTTSTAVPTGSVQLLVDGAANGLAVPLSAGTASLTLSTVGFASGSHTVTAAYSGDGTYTGSKGSVAIDLTSAASADFSVTGSASSVTVAAGGTASPVTFTVTSLNGFVGSVSLSASTASSLNASAQFSVTPVTLTSGSSATSAFTFYAFVNDAAAKPVTLLRASQTGGVRAWELAGGGMAFASLLLVVMPGRRRSLKGVAGILSVALLSAAALGLSGCGGSSGSSTGTTSTQTNSAAGTYTLTITGASGTTSHSTTLTVVVQ